MRYSGMYSVESQPTLGRNFLACRLLMLWFPVAYNSSLKMEASYSFEISSDFQGNKGLCENLKSYITTAGLHCALKRIHRQL
jgi:hypothetical protein